MQIRLKHSQQHVNFTLEQTVELYCDLLKHESKQVLDLFFISKKNFFLILF